MYSTEEIRSHLTDAEINLSEACYLHDLAERKRDRAYAEGDHAAIREYDRRLAWWKVSIRSWEQSIADWQRMLVEATA